jgi:glycosyltransferase involved in cell wall biosynthesis
LGNQTLPLNILSITTLYPNVEDPTFGVFVENRLRKLKERAGVQLKVVAPVPWFPFSGRTFGRYGRFARVPLRERRHGIEISHPRYVQIPKIGTHLSPFLLYLSLLRHLRAEGPAAGDIDVIDAHVYYPDGVAATLLARSLRKPLTVTARGTDLNLYPKRYPLVGHMIARAAREVDASITVCAALKEALVGLGAAPKSVHVMRNGVDLELFCPVDREAARRRWQVTRPTLLSIGHLIERKGHHLVIQALADLQDVDLMIAGDGPERGRLERLRDRLGLGNRVRFLGVVAHHDLKSLYSAADALVLASSREGWPNVLLESLASGTPVIATRNWGTPEIVTAPEAGLLIDERAPDAIADAARRLLAKPPARTAIRRFAEGFSWDATTDAQLRLFSSLLDARASGRLPAPALSDDRATLPRR